MAEKKETGFFRQIGETLNGKNGRKNAFGIWLFWTATALLKVGLIPADLWWKASVVSGALIGFGTILDKIVENYAATIINRMLPADTGAKTTVTATTTVGVDNELPRAS